MAPDGRPAAKLPAEQGGDDDVNGNKNLSAGEAASLQLLCRGEDGETQVDLQVSRDGTGITLRTVPERAAAANVSYLFEYPAKRLT